MVCAAGANVCFGSKADIRFYPQESHNYHIKYMCCLNATYYLERVTAFDPKQIFRLSALGMFTKLSNSPFTFISSRPPMLHSL